MIKIGIFEKNNNIQSTPEKYILKQKEYEVLFFSDKLILQSSYDTIPDKGKLKSLVNGIKSIFFNANISKDNLVTQSKFLKFNFDNCNLDAISKPEESKLIYYDVYPDIDIVYYTKDENLECTFILKENANPNNISISFDGNYIVDFDENNDISINIDNSNIIIRKPTFKDLEIDFILKNNKVTLDLKMDFTNDIKDYATQYIQVEMSNDVQIESIFDSNNLSSIDMCEDNPLSIKGSAIPPQKYPIGTRHLLIKVRKSKFSYPFSKSTALLCYPNLPVIEDLYISSETKKYATSIPGICSTKNITAFINYKETSLTPYISYSIVLYSLQLDANGESIEDISNIDSNIIEVLDDIDNIDIYALQNDYFVGNKFNLCGQLNDPTYKAVDFLVDLDIGDNFIVTPIETADGCYLYDITVNISLYKAPPIEITDLATQEALNEALGLPKDSTEPFTPGQLESISILNLSDNSTLNMNILKYTPNIIELNISNCDVYNIDTYYLKTLSSLEILNISNNNVSDLTMLKDLKHLRILNISGNAVTNLDALENFTNLTILNASSAPSDTTLYMLSLTTLSDRPSNKIVNIDALANLKNLIQLNLADNEIDDISPLSNLLELEELDISGNSISNLYPLKNLIKLSSLNAENQIINYGALSPSSGDDLNGYTFILELLDFQLDLYTSTPYIILQDIDGSTPYISHASNGGYCHCIDSCSGVDSCDCQNIVWKDIKNNTNSDFTFTHDIICGDNSNFSGIVNVILQIHSPVI